MKRLIALIILNLTCITLLNGCTDSNLDEFSSMSDEASTQVQEYEGSKEQIIQAKLLIGTNNNMKEYIADFKSEPTPDMLIQAIEEKTGWELSLAEPVSIGKGGMTVIFSKEGSIFSPPPEPQKDEFHVYDQADFIYHILDSIQETLQINTIDTDLGNSSSVDIYFAIEGDEPISFPDLNIEIPIDRPYKGSLQLSN